jgi:5-methylcytosine-specific restriction endonuclease McrA
MDQVLRLEIEMVPKTCWYSNVRSNVTASTWNIIKKQQAGIGGRVCQICGDSGLKQGYRWPVECHEVWKYSNKAGRKVQRLDSMISLCPRCHEVKHFGLATVRDRQQHAIDWLMHVNNITEYEARKHADSAVTLYRARTLSKWELDISYLARYGVVVNSTDRKQLNEN